MGLAERPTRTAPEPALAAAQSANRTLSAAPSPVKAKFRRRSSFFVGEVRPPERHVTPREARTLSTRGARSAYRDLLAARKQQGVQREIKRKRHPSRTL